MNLILFYSIAAIFYLSVVVGASIRHRRLGTLHTRMQMYGALVSIPAAAAIGLGFNHLPSFLFTVMIGIYGFAWLCMSTGYLLEALNLKRKPPDE